VETAAFQWDQGHFFEIQLSYVGSEPFYSGGMKLLKFKINYELFYVTELTTLPLVVWYVEYFSGAYKTCKELDEYVLPSLGMLDVVDAELVFEADNSHLSRSSYSWKATNCNHPKDTD